MDDTNENFAVPVVCAIIERVSGGVTEVLVQTRWKPEDDPVYSGTIELPVGKIRSYEGIYDALKREVLEETGLIVSSIKPSLRSKSYTPKDDSAFAFQPFTCFQQMRNGKPWIGFAFICEVASGEPKPQGDDTKEVRWMKKTELKKIFDLHPENIFTLELGILELYFNDSQ